jgi:hypothetical protein
MPIVLLRFCSTRHESPRENRIASSVHYHSARTDAVRGVGAVVVETDDADLAGRAVLHLRRTQDVADRAVFPPRLRDGIWRARLHSRGGK